MNEAPKFTSEVVGEKSIFSNYAILLSRTFVSSGINIISSIFIYRVLSVESVGLAAIYVVVRNSIVALFLVWPVTGFTQYGREEYDQTGRFKDTFGSILMIVGILFVMSSAACIILRKQLMGYIGLPVEWLWLLILDLLFMVLGRILNQFFFIIARIRILSVLDLLNPLLMLVFVVYVWLIMGRIEVTTYLFVSAGLSAFTLSLYAFYLRDQIFPLGFSRSEAKRILRFSGFLYGAVIFSFIYDQFDFIIINRYRPADQLAYYSLAYRIYIYLTALPLLSINIVYPVMISYRTLGRRELFQKYYNRTIPQMFFFWTIACMAFLLIVPPVIPALFGSPYRNSISCLSIFCLSALFQFTIAFHSPILTSHERVKWAMQVNLIGTILIAVGNFLLIPSVGIFGAALATLISYAFNSLAYAYLSARIVEGRYRGYEMIMGAFYIPIVIATIMDFPFVIRILIFLLELGGMFWWSCIHNLFDRSDLFFLERLSLPEKIKGFIYMTFMWLEPRRKIAKGVGP